MKNSLQRIKMSVLKFKYSLHLSHNINKKIEKKKILSVRLFFSNLKTLY